MNLPNKLTLLRVIMIPFFVLFMLTDFAGEASKYIALAIFCAASFTDYLDGHLARRDNLVTDFGKDAVSYAVRQANISSAPGIKYIRTTAMNFLRRQEDGAIKQHTEPNANKPKYGSGIVV